MGVIDPNVMCARLVNVLKWINGHRNRGHLRGFGSVKNVATYEAPTLDYKFYGFSDNDLDEFLILGVMFITRNKFRYVIWLIR